MDKNDNIKPLYLNYSQVCALIGVQRKTLFRWVRDKKDFPSRVKTPSGRFAFLRKDIETFIARAEAAPTYIGKETENCPTMTF